MAIVLGITIGALWPAIGSQLKPIGDGFIRLIKMVIAPIIFLVIVTGIAHVGDVKSVGRVGVKALGYFLAASTFALAFGMLVGNVVRPGAGLHIDPASLNGADVEAKTGGGSIPDAATFLLHVIPESVIQAFAENSLLQVLFFAVFFGAAMVVVPLWEFIKYARSEFLLALGTASTEAVLPRIMTKLTKSGNPRSITGLVVPTGYSFNLDGTAIYLSISLLFLAQAFGIELTLGQQLAALGVLLLTSKGMAGVPGSSFLALSATATALGIFPVAGVALLLGTDRLMDSMRVSVNLLGNCVATFIVSRWENQLDYDQMRETFASASDTEIETIPAPALQSA